MEGLKLLMFFVFADGLMFWTKAIKLNHGVWKRMQNCLKVSKFSEKVCGLWSYLCFSQNFPFDSLHFIFLVR